jgi:hypothetical protein
MIRRSFLKTFAGTVLISGRGKKMPFGNAVGEGFVNSGIVIARKVILEGPNGGSLLGYDTSKPTLGGLITSINPTGVSFIDSVGNEVLPGNISYSGSGSAWFASGQSGGSMAYFFATAPGGPYTVTAQLVASSTGVVTVNFKNGAVAGTWPQSGGSGITTVAQVVAALEAMGLLTA